jgi:hypothetical protein
MKPHLDKYSAKRFSSPAISLALTSNSCVASTKQSIIINVGTNNVSSSQSVNTILSYHGDLIYELKRIIRAKLIFTSILPRLVDHRDSESKVCKVFAF